MTSKLPYRAEDDEGLNELEKIRKSIKQTPKIIEDYISSGSSWMGAFEKHLETLRAMIKGSGKDRSIVPEYKESLTKRFLSVKEEFLSKKSESSKKNLPKESKNLLLKMLNNLRRDE